MPHARKNSVPETRYEPRTPDPHSLATGAVRATRPTAVPRENINSCEAVTQTAAQTDLVST